MLILQRIRNRVIEYLTLASSYQMQREYEASVPNAIVPDEIINQWEDLVNEETLHTFTEPVVSHAERIAIQNFHSIWNSVAENTPDPLPPLNQLIGTEQWERLRVAAQEALLVFAVRGTFGEATELSRHARPGNGA
jgi:hypothetical protein